MLQQHRTGYSGLLVEQPQRCSLQHALHKSIKRSRFTQPCQPARLRDQTCAPVPQLLQHTWQSQKVRQQPAWICRTSFASQATPEPIPDDVQLELNPDQGVQDVVYDEASKTVRIPLMALADGQRRTKMVMFTCNKCGGRSARLVNPIAWEKGAVFCQCQHCAAWHMLKADKSIIEEIRYNDPDWKLPEAQQGTAAAAAAAAGGGSQGTAAAAAAAGGSQGSAVVFELPAAAGGDGGGVDATEESQSSSQQSADTHMRVPAAGDDEVDSQQQQI